MYLRTHYCSFVCPRAPWTSPSRNKGLISCRCLSGAGLGFDLAQSWQHTSTAEPPKSSTGGPVRHPRLLLFLCCQDLDPQQLMELLVQEHPRVSDRKPPVRGRAWARHVLRQCCGSVPRPRRGRAQPAESSPGQGEKSGCPVRALTPRTAGSHKTPALNCFPE